MPLEISVMQSYCVKKAQKLWLRRRGGGGGGGVGPDQGQYRRLRENPATQDKGVKKPDVKYILVDGQLVLEESGASQPSCMPILPRRRRKKAQQQQLAALPPLRANITAVSGAAADAQHSITQHNKKTKMKYKLWPKFLVRVYAAYCGMLSKPTFGISAPVGKKALECANEVKRTYVVPEKFVWPTQVVFSAAA
eukprot:jgi/Chlat1/3502/Chrsp23S03791